MTNKIRVGVIGASVNSPWGSKSHIPALQANPDCELTAVCTTNPQSAEASRQAFGAKLAFSDYREMVKSPDIDAVAAVVRVHSHFEVTKAAIEAGKPVYTEWPLGRTTEEAVELARLAKAKGLQTAVGLQSRVSPALQYMKELIEGGYVGEVLTVFLTTVRHGHLEKESTRNWQHDVENGANPLTICAAHVIDALRFVAGDIVSLGGMVSTQIKQWYAPDTQQYVDVTSPDTVMLAARLANGAVASIGVGSIPWAPSGYRMEIYGKAGTLVVTGKVTSQRGDDLRLRGAQRGDELKDLEIPERFVCVPKDFPRGNPFNVGQMYTLFAQGIRTGKVPDYFPTFDTAVDLHHLIDAIRRVSDEGRVLPVGGS